MWHEPAMVSSFAMITISCFEHKYGPLCVEVQDKVRSVIRKKCVSCACVQAFLCSLAV